jgi:hypothetical protein
VLPVRYELNLYMLYRRKPVQKGENTAIGIRHADHVAPSNPQKLALTSPTSGGLSVGTVRLQTQVTEFIYIYICKEVYRLCGLIEFLATKRRCIVLPVLYKLNLYIYIYIYIYIYFVLIY